MKKFLRIGLLFLLLSNGMAMAQPSLQKMRAKLEPTTPGQPAGAKMTIEAQLHASVFFTDITITSVRQA